MKLIFKLLKCTSKWLFVIIISLFSSATELKSFDIKYASISTPELVLKPSNKEKSKIISSIFDIRNSNALPTYVSNVVERPSTCTSADGKLLITLSGGALAGVSYELDIDGDGIYELGPIALTDLKIMVVTSALFKDGYSITTTTARIRRTDTPAEATDAFAINRTFIGKGPQLSIIPMGQISLCNSQPVLLKAQSSGTIQQWYRNGQPISGATGDTYSVTTEGRYNVIAKQGNCSDSSVISTVAVVSPLPATNIAVQNPATICIGESAQVTLTNAQIGVNYTLFKGSNPVDTVIGAGANLSFTVPSSQLSIGNNDFNIKAKGSNALSILSATRTNALVFDGDLSERGWNLNNTLNKVVEGGPEQTITAFGTQWDDSFLYVGLLVQDKTLTYLPVATFWNSDGIEVYIDGDNSKSTVYDVKDRQFIVRYGDNANGVFSNQSINGVEYKWKAILGGYSMEIKIPWSNFNIPANEIKIGKKIGFDIGNNDNQGGISRTTQSMYSGSDQNWNNTSQFTELVLAGDQLYCISEVTINERPKVEVKAKPIAILLTNNGSNAICNGENRLLSIASSTAGFTVQWYRNGQLLADSTNNSICVIKEGRYNVVLASSLSCNDSAAEPKVITLKPTPDFDVTLSPPTTCNENGSLIITGKGTGIQSGSTYLINTGETTDTSKIATSQGILLVRSVNTYPFVKVTSANNCSRTIAGPYLINFPTKPEPPTIVGKSTYCQSDIAENLTATGVAGASIVWYEDAMLQTVLQSGADYKPKTTVAGIVPYYAVQIVNGCKSLAAAKQVNIVALPKVQQVTGMGGPATCNGKGYDLKLKTEAGVNYTIYKGNTAIPTVAGNGEEMILSTLTDDGNYTVKAATTLNNCKADMTGNLVVTPKVDPTKFTVSGGAEGCEGTVASAKITLSGSENNVTYTLNSGESMLGNGGSVEFLKATIATNNNTYTAKAKNNATGCESTMLGEAKINIQGGLGDPSITVNAVYCNNNSAQIVLVVGNANSKTWTLTPAAAGTITSDGFVTWSDSYTGPATIKVAVQNTACGTAEKTTSVSTTVASIPEVSPIIGDSLVCRGNTVTYQVVPQAGVSYIWSINLNARIEQEDSLGIATVTYREDLPKEGVLITVTPKSVSCGIGSPKSKEIKKDNGCDLYVPNILTLSNTDKNSIWQLEGIENFPKLSIQIFNRWGAEVFNHRGLYSKAWDGTTQGNPLPTATYYYLINKNDGSKAITGTVTVISQ